jgi:hypothetical protein
MDALFKGFGGIFKFVAKIPEKLMKKGFTGIKASIKDFLRWENWPYFLAIIVIIILVWLLLRYRKRRRAREAEEAVAEGAPEGLPPSSLINIWKEFIKEIPGEFRRSIMLFHPFVVFGEAGTGKSLLVDTYTDWKGQANQFYPSYTVNPLLQIYLGSKALVQEIPAALLNDTSMEARSALLKLWKPLFRWKDPTVVIVLDVATLQSDSLEALKQQAQMIRGKINILSRVRKKPIKVHIALTFMNHVEGHFEFFDFLRQNNMTLEPEFKTPSDLINVDTCLEPYEELLPLALTTLPAENYLKIISFFRNTPELLSVLSVFIKILQSPDPLSPEPEISRLYLTSQDEKDRVVSNPFKTYVTERDILSLLPLYKNQIAAAALALFGFILIFSGFIHERRMINNANRILNSFQNAQIINYEKDMRRQFLQYTSDKKGDIIGKFLPGFSGDLIESLDQKIKKQYAANIRNFYLLPRLEHINREENAQDKKLFLLSLIYASNRNELGKLIIERMEKWTHMLGFPEILVRDYLENNQNVREISIPVSASIFRDITTVSYDPQPWMIFFNKVNKVYEKPFLSEKVLDGLQVKAASLINAIQEAERYDLSLKITELLKKETPLGIQAGQIKKSKLPQLLQPSLRAFLVFLQEIKLSYPSAEGINFKQLLDTIEIMMPRDDEKDETMAFAIANETYSFSSKKWNELIATTAITLFLRDFEDWNYEWNDGLSFFETETGYPGLVMNASNDGRFIFTGKGEVNGRFTRDAFEKEVRPVLDRMPEFVEKLPVGEEEKIRFSKYVLSEVDAYSQAYVSAYTKYYRQFSIQAKTIGELQYVLTQMQLPTSPFHKFLETIREHTTFTFDENPYMRSFEQRLKVFEFVKRIMQERKEEMPELDKYKAILGQMKVVLESTEPFAPVDENGEANDLKAKLTPMGRFFLSIFRNEENSYYNMVTMWLESVGIDTPFQYLFLEPIRQAYLQGLTEVETMVNKVWEALWEVEVRPVFDNFPFNTQVEQEIAPSSLEALLTPGGHFRKTFKSLILPVCQINGDTLTRRDFPMGSITLPENMFETEKEIRRLSKIFLNEEGTPQPLTIFIKPLLSRPSTEQDAMVLLSYLQAGKLSVFGFYQQPRWQKFQFEWWKDQPSSVGVEVVTKKKSRKSSRGMTIPKSSWSLYRLLQKAEIIDDNTYVWKIYIPEMKTATIDLKFAIKDDPWAFFKNTSNISSIVQ